VGYASTLQQGGEPVERHAASHGLQRHLKALFDPYGILNPGKA